MDKAFEKYLKNYNMEDPDINYKYHHSYRVMNFAKMLSENLTKEDQYLATLIGLYHDIGRFKQDELYNTYDDSKEFDHALYGVKVLFEDNLIKEIPVSEKYYKIIAKAIKNHNKYEIETGLTKEELFHSKLIRDADKLDILEMTSKKKLSKKSVDLENPEFNIRKKITEEFFNKKTIKNTSLIGKKTNSEKIISYLALVFDLNFKKSAQYLLEKNIIENFYNNLKNKENYQKYFTFAENYLKEMVKC